MGQLPKRDFHIFCIQDNSARAFNPAFQELGLPYSCTAHVTTQDLGSLVASPSFGSAGFEKAQGFEGGSLVANMEGKGQLGDVDTINVQTDAVGTRCLTGHSVKSNIKTYEQSSLLLEVVCQQFSLWTGRRAPRSVIADALE